MARNARTFVAALSVALCSSAAAAQTAYTIQGVGNQTNGTYPQVINDVGDVAGYHYPNGQQRAFVFVNGVFTDIGTLGGTYSAIYAINAAGKGAGYSYLSNNIYHAIVYDGSLRDLGTFNAGGYSYAYDINDSDQVVGYSDGFAFRYSGGSLQKLINLLPAGSGWTNLYEAIAINNAGQITGRGYHSTLGQRAFLFTPATGATPASIVAFGDSSTSPRWINASGQVAGTHSAASGNVAFLYTPGSGGGTFTTLNTFGGTYMYPYALNDAGQVVGYSYLSGNSAYHAFLYSNGQTTDLGTSAGSFSYATGINNSGVIVGYSNNGPFVYTNGVMRLLTNLVSGCNWSVSYPSAVNNAGQITGYGYDQTFGQRGYVMTPAQGALTTSLTVSPVSGSYQRDVQLQARLLSSCSSVAGATVSFSLNGTGKGTAVTQDDGWARLATNIGTITPGTYPGGVAAEFGGDATFLAASGSATLTVSRANPVITWNPQAIVEGTPIGSNQLNATADTAGTFFYSPQAGAILAAGLRRLNATFVPADATDYNTIGTQAYLAVRASNPPVSFTADEIPGLGGTSTEVTAFNNLGQAAGYSYLAGNPSYHAFLFSGGVTTDIGTLGGPYSYANALSDTGAVTGWSYTSSNYQHAFLYSNGTMTDLHALITGANPSGYSEGRAMNAAGDVALYALTSSGYQHAHLYSGGTVADLGSFGSYSIPNAVNSAGQVAGFAYTGSCYHAFRATTSGMVDLGTLGGSCSQATAINDNGDVVGWSYTASDQLQHAFVYRNGTMTDLGTLGGSYSFAQAINSAGVITGYSYTLNNQSLHAFQYANGVMTDLGAIAFQSRGNDINDAGDIVGYTYTAEGNQTAFLRTAGPLLDLNSLINVGETAGVNEARFNNTPGQILARGFSGNATLWYVLSPTTLAASSISVTASAGVFGGTTTLTATLSITNPSGALVRFTLNGNQVGTAFADAQGVATLTSVALGTLPAGTNTAAAAAIFPGDATYAGSTATADVIVGKATPAITWNNPADIQYGTALSGVQLNASSSVAGSFAYSPGAGTVLAAGNNQVLAVTFTPSNSNNYTTASKNVSINVLRVAQTISFAALPGKTYGDAPFTLSASATSGLAVTFSLGSSSVGCALNGTTVTITGATAAGQSCTIVASQAGNPNYNAAPDVPRSFAIAKATQTITFGALPNKMFGDAPFGLTATSAGGTVAFSLGSGSAGCSISGGTVTITGATAAGQSCLIVASQGGDANYLAASDVTRSFTIAKANQSITVTLAAPASAIYNTTFNTAATGGGSSSPVVITTGGVCSATATGPGAATVQMTSGTGSCALYYNQAADANYNAAAQATGSTAAQKATQVINVTTAAPTTAVFGTSFTVAATGGGSANAVTSTTPANDGCSDVGPTFTVNSGITPCQVQFNQAGDANYMAASQVTQTVNPVGYTFEGFYQPIDMSSSSLMVWNSASAGQAIPVKWRLTLNGTPVSSLQSFVTLYSTPISCTTAGTLDAAIEEYATGGSGLIYDGDGYFHYNWKTPSSYKGKCYALSVSYNDGSASKTAYFKFK